MSLRSLFLAGIALACLLAGCSLTRPPAPGKVPATDLELTTVPFFPQEEYQCGPAALAAILVSSDVVTLPDFLSPDLYIPERRGTLQLELVAVIRNHRRIPYQLRPELDAIAGELLAGRPVLVLQNLGLKILPTYHYAVVIGMRTDGSLILRSGTTERLVMDRDDFFSTWEKAGKWALVALKSDELPADHDLGRYLEAVARMEATGHTQLAEECYRTVLAQHPHNDLAIFGLANTMFMQGHFTVAATFYSYLLRRDPSHAEAANNLAEALAALHCYDEALELLDRFL